MLNKPVILVAEDNDGDVLTIRRAFRDAGVDGTIRVVNDGEQAIAYLRGADPFSDRTKYPFPDLLLLDLKMPRTDGFQVLTWLRDQPELSSLRTVVLTTSDQIKDVNQAYAAGASSFLVKPLAFAEFRDTLAAMQHYWLNVNRNPVITEPEQSFAKTTASAAP